MAEVPKLETLVEWSYYGDNFRITTDDTQRLYAYAKQAPGEPWERLSDVFRACVVESELLKAIRILVDKNDAEKASLRAEVERLRDGVQKVVDKYGRCEACDGNGQIYICQEVGSDPCPRCDPEREGKEAFAVALEALLESESGEEKVKCAD